MHRRPRYAFSVGALLLTACTDVASVPPRLAATYVVETVNGRRPPAVAAEGNGFQVTVIADTLEFKLNGEVQRRSTRRFAGVLAGVADTTVHTDASMSYTIDGDKLAIFFVCPANANCIGPISGHIDAHRLDIIDVGMSGASLHFTTR